MKFLATTTLAVLVGACGAVPANPGDSSEQSSDVTCSQIDDHTYASVLDHSIGQQCGTNLNGDYVCTPYSGSWTLYFGGSDHQFFWGRGQLSTGGTYTCSRAGIVFSGEVSNNQNLKTLVRDTTIYLMDTSDSTDKQPLQSRSHQYELAD